MQWFKHYSNASNDDFLEELESKFGLEGYARWWKLLEVIAEEMERGSDLCHAKHSLHKWSLFLKGKQNKLSSFLVYLENKQKINLEQTENILKIECPKLLELRDNYTKKYVHDSDKCPPKNKEVRSKNINIPPVVPPEGGTQKRASRLPENWQPDEQLLSWAASKHPQIDVSHQTDLFRNHFLANGKPMLDWRRAWMNWITRAASGVFGTPKPPIQPKIVPASERKGGELSWDSVMP